MLIITYDIYKFPEGCFPSNVSERSNLTHNELPEPETPMVDVNIRCKIKFLNFFSNLNEAHFTILTHFHL